MDIEFETSFDPRHGEAVPVARNVLRVTAGNVSPFTFQGTNSYVVGDESVVVIDPGPADERHFAALIAAIGGRKVDAILVTHSHRDHTELTDRLRAATGAPVFAEGPHRTSRNLQLGEINAMDAAGDMGFRPDRVAVDGDMLEFPAGRFEAVATPGHTANHMAFAFGDTLFSGDHVMVWSTTIVAPPDGAMADYMASLDRLLARDETLFLPGHGGPVRKPKAFMRGLKTHRRMRETAILERLRAGDRTIPEIVAAIYRQTDPRLHGAAGLSVLAHLEDLVGKGAVTTPGAVLVDSVYTPA